MGLYSDSEVKDEGFLEYINQLLMTGEVTGLFPKDELDSLINDIRPIYRTECPGAAHLQTSPACSCPPAKPLMHAMNCVVSWGKLTFSAFCLAGNHHSVDQH